MNGIACSHLSSRTVFFVFGHGISNSHLIARRARQTSPDLFHILFLCQSFLSFARCVVLISTGSLMTVREKLIRKLQLHDWCVLIAALPLIVVSFLVETTLVECLCIAGVILVFVISAKTFCCPQCSRSLFKFRREIPKDEMRYCPFCRLDLRS